MAVFDMLKEISFICYMIIKYVFEIRFVLFLYTGK